VRNDTINNFLCKSLGLGGTAALQTLSANYFCKHTDLFDSAQIYKRLSNKSIAYWNAKSMVFEKEIVDSEENQFNLTLEGEIILKVRKGTTTLRIPAYKNIVYVTKAAKTTENNLKTVTVWVDKNGLFYVPKSVVEFLK
jgi:hypothetical protein